MSITFYNYTPPLKVSEQVVQDANNNNYTLSKYIGIDANGNITNENKTTSNPVTAVETQALTNTQANPSQVLILDATNKIGIKTGVNLNFISGVFPHCDIVNAQGTSYSASTFSGALQVFTGPTQSGILQEFIAYTNGVVACNSIESYKYLVTCSISVFPTNSSILTIEIYKNAGATGVRSVALVTANFSQHISIVGILTLTQNDQLRLYAGSNISTTTTIQYLRWTITKI